MDKVYKIRIKEDGNSYVEDISVSEMAKKEAENQMREGLKMIEEDLFGKEVDANESKFGQKTEKALLDMYELFNGGILICGHKPFFAGEKTHIQLCDCEINEKSNPSGSDDGKSFSRALVALKNGKKAYRMNWSGKEEQFIKMQFPTPESKMTRPYIYIHTSDNLIPWLASQADLIEEDWVIF